ncbi:MAG: imidazoleglycerol-phosphate dehydratase HisB [Anaerovoracaceae bacterium]|jgi:imidazoleglycerol-phosphate dehydratase
MRKAKIERKTAETAIVLKLNLDGTGQATVDTGVGFLDHMLTLLAFHGSFDLTVECSGDTFVDDHHSVEDIGIVLGQAFREAIGDRVGIKRYADLVIPMDEALCHVAVDISNRPYLVYNMLFQADKIGDIDTQNFKEFFRAFVNEARITLHINLIYGENDHHSIEAAFKAFARALRKGVRVVSDRVSSSKGVL